jgi:hypothetical protein
MLCNRYITHGNYYNHLHVLSFTHAPLFHLEAFRVTPCLTDLSICPMNKTMELASPHILSKTALWINPILMWIRIAEWNHLSECSCIIEKLSGLSYKGILKSATQNNSWLHMLLSGNYTVEELLCECLTMSFKVSLWRYVATQNYIMEEIDELRMLQLNGCVNIVS